MEIWFWTIYLFLVAGAAGLYLLMAHAQRPAVRRAALIAGLLSLPGVFISLLAHAKWTLTSTMVWFCLLGIAAVLTAALMIIQRRPVYSALFFVMTLIAVAGLILLQQATFLAFALVIVYAGAILVVYVFVLMLTRQDQLPWYDLRFHMPLGGVLVGFVIIGVLLRMILSLPAQTVPPPAGEATTDLGTALAVGQNLYSHHFVALQIAGLILLVAAVGAAVLVRTRHAIHDNLNEEKTS